MTLLSSKQRGTTERQHRAPMSNPASSFLGIDSSFNKLLLEKEELEQKHLHLLQIVESEKTAKWQYTQQCEELTSEIKKLRAEVSHNNPRIAAYPPHDIFPGNSACVPSFHPPTAHILLPSATSKSIFWNSPLYITEKNPRVSRLFNILH